MLHFVKTNRHFQNSKVVEKELKKFVPDYSKTENYLKNVNWVNQFVEKLEIACNNVKSIEYLKGSSYSNVYKAIEQLEKDQ